MTALKIIKPEIEEGLIALLEKVPLFGDIKDIPGAIEEFASYTSTASFRAGDLIIKEGDKGDRMFILTQGKAAVYRNTADGEGYKVVILSGDDHPFFGEGALLDEDGRTASIKAESDCRCVVLTRAAFDEFGGKSPHLALPIMKKVSRAVMRRVAKQGNDLVLLYNALVSQIRGS